MTESYRSRQAPRPSHMRLYRDRANARCMGVCAGLADHFGFNVKGVRIATIISTLVFPGPTILTYCVLGFVLKDKPADLEEGPAEHAFWRDVRSGPRNSVRDLRHRFRELERRLRAAEAHVTSREYRIAREIDDL